MQQTTILEGLSVDVYLKGASREKSNWRLRIWLLLALAYASTGLAWWMQEHPTALFGAEATPTVVVTEEAVREVAVEIMERGDLYFDQGNVTAALESYEEAVAADPNMATAYARWGQLLNLRYESDEALIRTERAISLAPEDPEVLAAHAMSLTWTKEFAEAIQYAERAIAADPEYGAGYAFLAEAYIDSQQYDAALETAHQAVEIDPDSVWAWLNLGYVLENFGRYEEAVAAYEEAIAVKPLSYIYNSIGRIQVYNQEYDAAIKSFKEATIVDPRNPEAYAMLGRLYIGLDNPTAAEDYIEQGIEQDPTFGLNHALLGQIYYSQLNFEAAIESLEKAISFGYSNEGVFYQLGLAYAYLEQCDQAVPWLERALEQNPDSGPAQSGMELCNPGSEPTSMLGR
ncbi:MAG: tetratricopeptide repeat protein [Chloroflexota bacterium]|nr:tetratricopeptide repeat protein [Chloroflexota bacterium]